MNCFIINITKKNPDIFVAKSLVTERANKLALLMWKNFLNVLIFLPSSNSASEIKDIRE